MISWNMDKSFFCFKFSPIVVKTLRKKLYYITAARILYKAVSFEANQA